MNSNKKHIGSKFDDFLTEEGLLEQVDSVAIKRVITHQIESAMRSEHLTKSMLARKMNTSRSAVDRLFDPENKSVTLMTLNKAASALGKKLEVQLV